jgi:hypothetical protein
MDVAYIFWTEPQAIVVPRPGEEPAVFLLFHSAISIISRMINQLNA